MRRSLEPEEVLRILQQGGPLSLMISGYESREAQLKMAARIVEAFRENCPALIEAGTGTGKSIAYLLPAILWAIKTGERTVISTNTINLQEQLIAKDIPLLLKALNVDLHVVLLKGMGNYVCKRNLREAEADITLFDDKERDELDRIRLWQENTTTGHLSELSFTPSVRIREKMQADGDTCSFQKCPHFKECFYFIKREEAENAKLLVVNHHLLFADLNKRSLDEDPKKKNGVLPDYTSVVIDEAHNIEHTATAFFGTHLSQRVLLRIMARLSSEKEGKLVKIRRLFLQYFPAKDFSREPFFDKIQHLLEIKIPLDRKVILQEMGGLFNACYQFLDMQSSTKLRIIDAHRAMPFWKEELFPSMESLQVKVKEHISDIESLQNELGELKQKDFQGAAASHLVELNGILNKLKEALCALSGFILRSTPEGSVRWMESVNSSYYTNVRLIEAPLDIAPELKEKLFNPFPRSILCSATLSVKNEFHYAKKRLGLDQTPHTIDDIFESPFDYSRQALLAVPNDLPSPLDSAFVMEASKRIVEAVKVSRGNALILFTSHKMLQDCQRATAEQLKHFVIFQQGEKSRHALIEEFRNTDRSILFATHSFWEGVDVAGDALRLVVLVKLPFQVPTEPIVEARSELIRKEGGSPFLDYSLPMAVVKFKQGFGRLIRHKKDRGCVLCLDPRLMEKPYGADFLQSLPNCNRFYGSTPNLLKEMDQFYRKTYAMSLSK